jgi:hypothetical protein
MELSVIPVFTRTEPTETMFQLLFTNLASGNQTGGIPMSHLQQVLPVVCYAGRLQTYFRIL